MVARSDNRTLLSNWKQQTTGVHNLSRSKGIMLGEKMSLVKVIYYGIVFIWKFQGDKVVVMGIGQQSLGAGAWVGLWLFRGIKKEFE